MWTRKPPVKNKKTGRTDGKCWTKIQTQDEFNRLDVLAQSVPYEPVYGAYLVARRERLFELRAVGKAYPDRRLIDTDRIKNKLSRVTLSCRGDDVRWASDRAWPSLAPRVERASEAAHCSARLPARGAAVAAP